MTLLSVEIEVHRVSMHIWIFPNFREKKKTQKKKNTEITEISSPHCNEMNINRLYM